MRLIAWHCVVFALVVLLVSIFPALAAAQAVVTNDPPFYGPYNGAFLAGGDGLEKKLNEHDSVLDASSHWTIYCWVNPEEAVAAPTLLTGIGDPNEEYPRYLALDADKVVLWLGKDNKLEANATLAPQTWQFLAATFDGNVFRLYSDGAEVASGRLALGSTGPLFEIAPPNSPLPGSVHFGGKIAKLTLLREALNPDAIKKLAQSPPNAALLMFEEGSKPWHFQTRDQAGYRAPQDPATMPRSRTVVPAEPSALYRSDRPHATPAIESSRNDTWTIGDRSWLPLRTFTPMARNCHVPAWR